jgi:Leucine-rich repeat (LRR) protein
VRAPCAGLETVPACLLRGIDLNGTMGLVLPQNALRDLPDAVGHVVRDTLIAADLSANRLARIPFALLGCSRLANLDLDLNRVRTLAGLPRLAGSLETLSVARNALASIDAAHLRPLRKLEWLHAPGNGFDLPDDAFDPDSDDDEAAGSCDNTGGETGTETGTGGDGRPSVLPRLRVLSLAHNAIRRVPRSTARLATSLVELRLAGNPLTAGERDAAAMWDTIAQLPLLEVLDLSRCGIGGPVPDGLLAGCPRLRSVNLSRNAITALPDFAGPNRAQGLRDLAADRNAIAGRLGGGIWRLPRLESLNLARNQISQLDEPADSTTWSSSSSSSSTFSSSKPTSSSSSTSKSSPPTSPWIDVCLVACGVPAGHAPAWLAREVYPNCTFFASDFTDLPRRATGF